MTRDRNYSLKRLIALGALGRRFESSNNRNKLQVLVDLNCLGHHLKNIGQNLT